MGCNKSHENLNDCHYFACSWVTIGDLGTLNAHCMSSVINILDKRVKSKCKCISMQLKMTVAGCDAIQTGRDVLTMIMNTLIHSDTLVHTYQTTHCHNPDDSHLHRPQYDPQISYHMKGSESSPSK